MNKKRAGVTLVELILAISVLTMITAPILGVMVSSFSTSAQALEMKNASFAAQQVMEEFIGRTWNGEPNPGGMGVGVDIHRWHPYLVHFGWGQPFPIDAGGRRFYFVATHNGFLGAPHPEDSYGRMIVDESGDHDVPISLLEVTVCIHRDPPGNGWANSWTSIRTSGGRVNQQLRPPTPLVSHTTWINIAPGGFVDPPTN